MGTTHHQGTMGFWRRGMDKKKQHQVWDNRRNRIQREIKTETHNTPTLSESRHSFHLQSKTLPNPTTNKTYLFQQRQQTVAKDGTNCSKTT